MVNRLGGAGVGNGVGVVFAVAVLTGKVGINGPGSGSLPQLDNDTKRRNVANKRTELFVCEYFEVNSEYPYLKNMRVSPPVNILRV